MIGLKQDRTPIPELHPSRLTYIRRLHSPREGQPMVVEYLDAQSYIYENFLESMLDRYKYYPHMYYLFLTRDSCLDVDTFAKRFPRLAAIYDVAVLTPALAQHFGAKIFPYTFVINERLCQVFQGVLTVAESPFMARLNLLGQSAKLEIRFPRESDVETLSNADLSLVLSGLKAVPKKAGVTQRSTSVSTILSRSRSTGSNATQRQASRLTRIENMAYTPTARNLGHFHQSKPLASLLEKEGYQRDPGAPNFNFTKMPRKNSCALIGGILRYGALANQRGLQ